MGSKRWYALHAYTSGDQDSLLVDSLAPLVRSRLAGGVGAWFFLRYWQRGPHVRVRLLLDEVESAGTLRAVREELRNHMLSHARPIPRERRLESIKYLAMIEGVEPCIDLAQENTVLDEAYEPEYEKYGGAEGVRFAEEVFCASSEIALDAVTAILARRISRLTLAFTMTLSALSIALLKPAMVSAFLERMALLWSRHVDPALANAWLAANICELEPYAAAVLGGAIDESSVVGTLTARWRNAFATAVERLDGSAASILPHVKSRVWGEDPERLRDFVLLNYIHTNNNRLGITPAQEAYVAYLGHRTLCGMLGMPSSRLLAPPQMNGK